VPYGGFFFPRKCFNVIGLPDPSYTLYMDDFEYTNRVVTKGGSIWLIPTSIVDDVEQSHHVQTAKKPLLYHSTLDTAQEFKVYYTVRNMIYFYEKHYGANAIIYYINQFILMTFLQVSALLRGKQSRLKLVKQAIKDGKEGKMGTRYELP
jgi:GT2 family glycosyltransferase